jgi:hypothetical protein
MISVVHHRVRGMITEHLLALTFPHGQRLRLGDDLTSSFPPALQHIANPDLRALLAQIDPTPDSLSETGAVDWGDLPDRLHFIADLFRCYQATPDLLEAPFLPEQVAEIKRGRLPPGPL